MILSASKNKIDPSTSLRVCVAIVVMSLKRQNAQFFDKKGEIIKDGKAPPTPYLKVQLGVYDFESGIKLEESHPVRVIDPGLQFSTKLILQRFVLVIF